MCGIFGVIGSVERGIAEHCVQRLRHRGPDGMSQWLDAGIFLGHTRLAIIDPTERARQPMRSPDGRYIIVFNGEIYNFVEVRKTLEGAGYRFATDSDTEVLLTAYVHWGEAVLDRLNGMWAFAVWDTHQRSLFLGRDRFGKKPLFYANIPGIGFVFASEMKAIIPLLSDVRPNAPLVRSRGSVFLYEATEECLVKGISRFPAGHYGWFRSGRLSVKRWWCTLDHLTEMPARYEDQIGLLRDTFVDACRLRMRSDVPIGTALSGGLDSSVVISAVAQVAATQGLERTRAGWQHAFVASFPGTPLDETAFANSVCEHLGITPKVIQVDPNTAITQLMRDLYMFEEIYITGPAPFMQTYEAVKRSGVSVTLDGHGADEAFGGYPMDFPGAIWDAGRDRAAREAILRAYFDAFPTSEAEFPRYGGLTGFWLKWQVRDFAKRLLGHNARWSSRDRFHPAWSQLDHLTRRLYVSTHETILPTLLRNYDRYSMASGVEIRMPFLDHRVICLAFSLPWSAKVRGGFSKAIVRDAFAAWLPPEISYRKTKIGFNAPMVTWMRGAWREFMLDTVASRGFRESTLVHARQAATAVRHVVNGATPTFAQAEKAWTLVTPYLWERAFLGAEGAPTSATSQKHDSWTGPRLV